jgi:hypothetical protein
MTPSCFVKALSAVHLDAVFNPYSDLNRTGFVGGSDL